MELGFFYVKTDPGSQKGRVREQGPHYVGTQPPEQGVREISVVQKENYSSIISHTCGKINDFSQLFCIFSKIRIMLSTLS